MVKVNFGIATRPKKGDMYNGDTYFIKEFDHTVLISVIDGLGHGAHAAAASSRCIRSMEEHFRDRLENIFHYCHNELKKTCGVVMGITSIDLDHSDISYAGVGNIGARLIGNKPASFISRNGIVGYNLPKIKVFKYSYASGDTILMYSDGITSKVVQYPASKVKEQDVSKSAEKIMKLYGRENDDATVIVAR